MVQRRAARWVTGRYHNISSVTDMLHSLDWRTLEQRLVDSRLCMLYKIRKNLLAIEEDKYFQRGTGRRFLQCRQIRADKDYSRFSFFPQTIIQWNQFPNPTCSATSPETFKTNVWKVEHSRLNNSQNIFYLFVFLSLFFLLFFLIPTDLSRMFHSSLFSLLALN